MSSERLSELLKNFQTNRPAGNEDIDAFQRAASIELPAEYTEFLRFTNGGEGFIGSGGYAMLWKVDDLLRFNREYEVAEYAPGLLLFGSSGGGEAFAFDFRVSGQMPVVSVPFVGLDLSEATELAKTFDGLLEYLAEQQ